MDNSVERILEHLKAGTNVVLEFGRHNSLEAYVLVANVLTRRIHDRYVDATERAMGSDAAKPRPLVITIEEAHKFLNPKVVRVHHLRHHRPRDAQEQRDAADRRPAARAASPTRCSRRSARGSPASSTTRRTRRPCCPGISGAQALKSVLARLDSKQQAIILGHAVPMPVVIKTRDYGTPESYAELTAEIYGSPNLTVVRPPSNGEPTAIRRRPVRRPRRDGSLPGSEDLFRDDCQLCAITALFEATAASGCPSFGGTA